MIEKTINLGTQTPQFNEHTLIVEVNRKKSRLFLCHGTQIDVLTEIHPDISTEYSDNEGHGNHGGTTHSSSSTTENNHLKEHNNKVHMNELTKQIKYLDGENKFTKLEIFTTPEFKKLLEEKLPKPMIDSAHMHIGNHSHSTIQEMIKKHNS